jgi:hypothetical protein
LLNRASPCAKVEFCSTLHFLATPGTTISTAATRHEQNFRELSASGYTQIVFRRPFFG